MADKNLNYSIMDIPGPRQFKIATVEIDSKEKSVRTPEWMIQMDNILYSNINQYTNFCELYGWYAESSRYTNGDMANELFTSATLRHSDVIIVIPNGGFGAPLQSYMNKGMPIRRMRLVRLGNVGQMRVKLQEIVHEICRIQTFQQKLDQLILHVQVVTKTDIHYVYDIKGQIRGQMVSSVSFTEADADYFEEFNDADEESSYSDE